MQILFDALGAQVQVQQATGNRLTTWFGSLAGLGYDCTISTLAPLQAQLANSKVYVSLTRQQAVADLSADVSFSYTPEDLYTLTQWVKGGGSVLMFTNHSGFPNSPEQDPTWPIFEIQLAAALRIGLVFASFAPQGDSPVVESGCPRRPTMPTLRMEPAAGAPAELVKGVRRVEAWDSGGIVPARGTPIIALPSAKNCVDKSGLEYAPDECAFAALYRLGAGQVIVIGHSGIAANDGTCQPSPGQIGSRDNQRFLNNCIEYLAR